MNDQPNRIFVQNDCEGNYKRVLCVCSGGILRSPTAAWVLSQPPYDYNTRCAGTESYALIPVTETLLQWAEELVCMKEQHLKAIKRRGYSTPANKIVLDIPDDYNYRDPKLIELIKERYDAKRYSR